MATYDHLQGPLRPPSPSLSLSYVASTAATSIRPSEGDLNVDAAKDTGVETTSYAPPHYDSEYAWHKSPVQSSDGKQYWYRNQDSMSNFILHWQQRFHGHGDMYLSGLLQQKSTSSPSNLVPADVQLHHIREAMRRMRFRFPFVALEVSKRSAIQGIEPLTSIPKFIAKNVDLQVALTYQIVHSDFEVEQWLDRLIVVHHEERTVEAALGPQQKECTDFVSLRSSGPQRCNRLQVHFWPAQPQHTIPPRLTLEQCHNTSDGVGTLLLYDDLLHVLAGVMADPSPAAIQWGPEVVRLPASLQDATAAQPKSWDVTSEELKQIELLNQDKLNGKTTPPTFIDKVGNKIVALALRNNNRRDRLRRKALNKPIVGLCRKFAQAGDLLPLGLLPQSSAKYAGPYGGTGVLTSVLSPEEAKELLAALKKKKLSPAPFLEAVMHMSTIWVRRERGLASNAKTGYDAANRVLGSFSNAVDRRNTLKEDQQRYHGLCLGGLPTKIGAGEVRWSEEAHSQTRPSRLDARDKVPTGIGQTDLETLEKAARNLAGQYNSGRDDPDWLRFGKATMFGTMETEYLFLTDENHYPSMPWLSSIGRIDGKVAQSRPIASSASSVALSTLEVSNLRVVGRMGIRQPVFHVYSFRGEMVMHLSYADWYYDRKGADGRRAHKAGKIQNKSDERWERDQSILQLWMEVYSELLAAFVREASSDEQQQQ